MSNKPKTGLWWWWDWRLSRTNSSKKKYKPFWRFEKKTSVRGWSLTQWPSASWPSEAAAMYACIGWSGDSRALLRRAPMKLQAARSQEGSSVSFPHCKCWQEPWRAWKEQSPSWPPDRPAAEAVDRCTETPAAATLTTVFWNEATAFVETINLQPPSSRALIARVTTYIV